MTQIDVEKLRKEVGMSFKVRRTKLLLSAKDVMEGALPVKISLPTIYAFEKGRSTCGDTRIIYDYVLKQLEK